MVSGVSMTEVCGAALGPHPANTAAKMAANIVMRIICVNIPTSI
jgi:hypothetical protein